MACLRRPMKVFFSSRRRHTRCLSDWSSAVSSSDLAASLQRDRGPRLQPAQEAACGRRADLHCHHPRPRLPAGSSGEAAMKRSSLTRQLIGGVLLAELICAAVFSFVAVGHEMHGRRRAFDVMLRGRADSLLGAVQDAEDPDDNLVVDPTELVLPRQDVYAVLNPAGRVLGQSPVAPPGLLTGPSGPKKQTDASFKANGTWYRAIRLAGVRVIDRENNGGLRRPVTVFYASPTRDLWHEAVEAVRFYVAAGALLLAITGIALVWFLRRRLSPDRKSVAQG